MFSLEQLKTLEKVTQQFNQQTKKTQGKKENKVYEFFKEKALQKYSEDLPIAKYFKTKEQLEEKLKDLFLNQKAENNATPEEVIDPINYVPSQSLSK